MKIYKYPLMLIDRQEIEAEIIKPLMVQVQNGDPYLWAEVDEGYSGVILSRTIITCETGDTPPQSDLYNVSYISTIQLNGCVWHYYMID